MKQKRFILIGIIAVLIFTIGKINWSPFEMARQEAGTYQPDLLFQGKVDLPDTIAYKKKKYLVFKMT